MLKRWGHGRDTVVGKAIPALVRSAVTRFRRAALVALAVIGVTGTASAVAATRSAAPAPDSPPPARVPATSPRPDPAPQASSQSSLVRASTVGGAASSRPFAKSGVRSFGVQAPPTGASLSSGRSANRARPKSARPQRSLHRAERSRRAVVAVRASPEGLAALAPGSVAALLGLAAPPSRHDGVILLLAALAFSLLLISSISLLRLLTRMDAETRRL
jgi:hypothetical protein